MNKKILGFLLWGMLLLGVIYLIFFQDKNIGYQVSELIPNKEIGLSHLKGSIKNVSNNTCKEVKINVKFSNGSIKDNGWITVESPKKGEITSFNELFFGGTRIDNIEDYKIKITSIECYN